MDTLVRDPFREALRAASGMSLQELFEGRDLHAYPAFERGELTEDEYWATYDAAGIDMDVDAFHATRRAGYAWLPGMRELVREVGLVCRVVVASNYSVWIRDLQQDHLDGVVEEVVASHQLGARKPDAAFYERLCARLGVAPGEVLLVDDRETNVEGAIAVGMPAVGFVDAPTLRRDLVSQGLLPA